MDDNRTTAIQADDSQGATAATGAAPRLFEKVHRLLREQLLSGRIPAGAVIRESVVAEELSVSRAPVRRALQQLEAEGLLAPHGAARIAVATSRSTPTTAPAAVDLAPIVAQASWERIYAEIEGAIVSRMSFGSWRLVESELARHYGVSRTVAREVLARLQQRGIVRKDNRSHWNVPGLGPGYMAELYELRWVLEPVALKKAAPQLPHGLIARCLADLDRAIADADRLDGPTLDALEHQLHVEILGHAGNATLTEALKLYQSLLIAHSFLYRTAPRVFTTEPFLPEHRVILEALADGRTDAAAAALEHHLRVSLDRAIVRVEKVRPMIVLGELPYLVLMSGD